MSSIEAFILGLIQGLTEFLPVSSSGHLELGKAILGVEAEESLIFTIVVHGATVLSTLVVFRKDILNLLIGLFKFRWNEETQYLAKIAVSMIPIMIVGLFFKDYVKALFTGGNVMLVGFMLIITAALLTFASYKKSGKRSTNFIDAFLIGVAQTIAVLPGISRSGSTIATGLIIGNKKELIAKFSFLMVLIPILGENFLEILSGEALMNSDISATALIVGFLAAFISGLLACTGMIKIVKRGKLVYFGIYCFVVGTIAVIYSFI